MTEDEILETLSCLQAGAIYFRDLPRWQPPPPPPEHHSRLTVRHRKGTANNAAASSGEGSPEKSEVQKNQPSFDIIEPNQVALYCGGKKAVPATRVTASRVCRDR